MAEDRIEMNCTDPVYGSVIGKISLIVHPSDSCGTEVCAIHNPTDHHMRSWEPIMRLDKKAIIERTCPHGIGHPDPDSLAFFSSIGEGIIGTHGCDGCCSPYIDKDEE